MTSPSVSLTGGISVAVATDSRFPELVTLTWLDRTRGLSFRAYQELHHWSVTDLAGFWSAIWEYYEVHSDTPYESVLGSREMPGARWFPGATLNYAGHALARRPGAPVDDEQFLSWLLASGNREVRP